MQRKDRIQDVIQDLHHGWRQLRRRPTFAVVSIVTLAIAIGSTTVVFSAADHVLLRPLPYREADRVVTLWETDRQTGETKAEVAPGNFVQWSERSESFESTGLVEPYGFDLTGTGQPVALQAWLVTEGYFDALGVRPLVGRLFEPEEYAYNGPFVVLLSHSFWQQQFGSDFSIVGREIELDEKAALVVGVLPRTVEYPESSPIWAPKGYRPGEENDRRANYMHAVGRLRPGVTVERAQADMNRVAAAMSEEYPSTNTHVGANVVPLDEQILGTIRPALLVLLGAVGFVLLIACANVASLLIARGAERARELGVRAALGAGRARITRQLLTESALLAVVGGAAGLGFAWFGIRAFRALSPPELPRVDAIALDVRVLLVSLGIMSVTAVLFGLAPAIRSSRLDVLSALRQGGRTATVGREGMRLRSLLVVGEISLALMLLVGAGLLLRSFMGLTSNDVGFITENRISLQMHIWDRNPTWQQRLQRFDEFVEQVGSTPGVNAVEMVSSLPFHPHRIDAQSGLVIEGRPPLPPGEQDRVYTTVATGGYFKVMGVPLFAGRTFTRDDGPNAPAVAIINQALRRQHFPDENPIGKQVTIGVMSAPVKREIIGVVGDVRPTTLDSDPDPELFVPFAQSGNGSITLVVETEGDPAALVPSIQAAIWDVDAGQAISHAATLEELITDTLVERRFNLMLLVFFSGVALVLATAGIYGLLSFSTAQRAGEIGVRLALGAQRRDVVTMILRQSIGLAIPGIVIGVAGALLLTRLMTNMLYSVTPADPVTFVPVGILMLVVAVLAAYVPARRAAITDPVKTLREE